MWCEDTFQTALSDQIHASRQEMFGALLLILATELCRANSNEDAVWPAVTTVLKADTVSFPLNRESRPSLNPANLEKTGSAVIDLSLKNCTLTPIGPADFLHQCR